MNFASVTDIAIPEGDVTKIQDADMTVLWEQRPKEYIFIIEADNGIEKAQREFSIIVEPANNSLFTFAVQVENELELIQKQFSIERGVTE